MVKLSCWLGLSILVGLRLVLGVRVEDSVIVAVFVVDFLAEALRELRKHNFTEAFDRYFRLGNHLNARDEKAVRKTVSGLIKLLHPDGDFTKVEEMENESPEMGRLYHFQL